MSCRIERLGSGAGHVVLCISGQITGQYVEMLRDLILQERTIEVIDLKDVLIVDREAVKLLAASEIDGTELKNCAAYIFEWVARERAQIVEQKETDSETGSDL